MKKNRTKSHCQIRQLLGKVFFTKASLIKITIASAHLLFSFAALAKTATFTAEITAQGEEIIGYEKKQNSNSFYFEVGGNESRTEEFELCMTAEQKQNACTLDTTRGKGGYTITKTSMNSPGGTPWENYYYDETKKCVRSAVTVHSKRKQRGWWASDQHLYLSCPVKARWTNKQTTNPIVVDDADGYRFITQYTGQIGSNSSATVDPVNGYSVRIINTTPADAVITAGMFASTPQAGNNGRNLYALYASNDIVAKAIEVTQGVQNIYNDMPLVAGRRTYVRVYANAEYASTNINAQLRGYKSGVEIPGSPLTAESMIPVRNSGIDRTNLDHAFLFKLPSNWYDAGVLELKATVDPEGLFKDKNSINNSLNQRVNFREGEYTIMNMVPVPLEIHENGDGKKRVFIYESTANSYNEIVDNLLRMHPLADQINEDCGIKPLKPTLEMGNWDASKKEHWGRMLSRVSIRRYLSGCSEPMSNWHGMVHPEFASVSALNGISYPNAFSSVVLMSAERSPNADWSVLKGETFAHEIGHNRGLKHECNHRDPDDVDPFYPYNIECYMSLGNPAFFSKGHDGYFMMDVYHDYWGISKPIILTDNDNPANALSLSPNQAYPMMSYYNSLQRWISPYSYCKLLARAGIPCDAKLISSHFPDSTKQQIVAEKDSPKPSKGSMADVSKHDTPEPDFTPAYPVENAVLPNGFRPAPVNLFSGTQYLMIDGYFDLRKTTLDSFKIAKYNTVPSKVLFDEASNFQIALLNQNATSYSNVLVLNQYDNRNSRRLLKTDIVADLNQHTDGNSPDRSFISLVGAAQQATYFELAYGSHIVASYAASTRQPSISITPFNENTLTADSVLQWVASDQDNDPLTFSIYYRKHSSDTWKLVDMEITGNSYSMRDNLPNSQTNPLRYYAGSTTGEFKVVANDGFYTAEATSNRIRVPYNKPEVVIRQQDGLSIPLGQTLNLNGRANDREDGAMPSAATIRAAMKNSTAALNNFRWSSSIDGTLGYGYELSTRRLSTGLHKITLSVTDSNNMTGEASIHVRVGMENVPQTNIAPSANATASSTYCYSELTPNDCYKPWRINDGRTSTALGGIESWSNDANQSLPQWVQLTWPNKVLITSTELYTTAEYPIQNYDLQYWNDFEWISFASVRGNTALNNKHALERAIITDKIRVLGLSGPTHQPTFIRVNELIVNGMNVN